MRDAPRAYAEASRRFGRRYDLALDKIALIGLEMYDERDLGKLNFSKGRRWNGTPIAKKRRDICPHRIGNFKRRLFARIPIAQAPREVGYDDVISALFARRHHRLKNISVHRYSPLPSRRRGSHPATLAMLLYIPIANSRRAVGTVTMLAPLVATTWLPLPERRIHPSALRRLSTSLVSSSWA